MCLWLQAMGAEVVGYSRAAPTHPSLYELARVGEGMTGVDGDIRDLEALAGTMAEHRPEVVVHMAAQPIVRRALRDPVSTYEVNVMGTVNVLEAVRLAGGVRVVVNVTTDKCYRNREWEWGYRETEAMGGSDPYSSSKACSELVTAAYRASFFSEASGGAGTAVATARAGNVIGGGDWGEDRLIPDAMRAALDGRPVRVRNPNAIRPWQHVLNPLSGYLALAQSLWEDRANADGWNFGPEDRDAQPVGAVVGTSGRALGRGPHVGAGRRGASARGALPEARLLAGASSPRLGAHMGARAGADQHRRLVSRLGDRRGSKGSLAGADPSLRGRTPVRAAGLGRERNDLRPARSSPSPGRPHRFSAKVF
ncbi:MAG: CDP-glucose 4,6-dehydratase [Hymenobacter sp.]